MYSRFFLSTSLVLTGCAGVFNGYGPGQTNEQRTSHGVSSVDPNATTGTYSSRSYNTGEHVLGAQIGARVGAGTASAGDLASGTAFALDAHVDFVYATERWGVGVSTGYTSDRLGANDAGATYFYSGFPLTAYGQWGLGRRIFVHGGLGRVIAGAVKRVEPDETSVDADAWRGSAGITFVFLRGEKKDFAIRFEGRVQRSADAQIDGMDAKWSSSAVLAELIYASF